ncbi:protein amalgam-like isoform X2 [Photinus pyralis]|uniref:Uncharacterized protein n=2 Tax=Photinus pyralis TaxID=7054 RepID=A0A1Y1JYF7_PHOPY|nr:protein amalgam-like isoform X2 [Photinus pyralis]
MRVIYFGALLIFLCTANGRPNTQEVDYDLEIALPEDGVQNDNYDYEEGEDEEGDDEVPAPIFNTRPRDFMVKENETVELPCEVENADTFVFMWKKNNEIVYQDTLRFSSFGNNFQLNKRSLIISNVGANETANYTCTIPLSKEENLSVTHHLYVQTAPKIESLKALHDSTQIDAGKSLVLTCKAIGFPKPTIVWSKKGHRLSTEGETISIENVSHHDAGDYQCLADNRIEPPAHKFIHISVAHQPVVTIEKLTVNSDENLDSQLICYVRAVPKAEVVWKKDGLNVVKNERVDFKHHNHTYILEINKVKVSDFGVYTCSAYNRVGNNEKTITLTGFPSLAEHVDTSHDSDKNVVVVWNVESNSPVAQYEIQYKKVANSDWLILHPEVSNAEGNLYTVNGTFTNLPGGHYEAKLRSRNTYGWSDYSPVVHFKSGGHHKHKPHKPAQNSEDTPVVIIHEPQAFDGSGITEGGPVIIQTSEQPAVQKSEISYEGTGGNGSSNVLPTLLLLCISLLSTQYSR